MTSLIAFLATNKIALSVGGILASIIAIYFKGYSSGKNTVRADVAKAEAMQAQEIQKTESKNQTLDAKREQDANAVNNTDTIDGLIRMWDELNKKTPRS